MTDITLDENGNFPYLYSADSKGKLLVWWMEVSEDKHRSCSRKGTDGKDNIRGWTTCKPKNIGKKNETSPEDQAIIEVVNAYTKKLKNHYHMDIADFNLKHYLAPMLAEKYLVTPEAIKKFWQEHSAGEQNEDTILIQPKLDGFRCVISAEGAFTRKGERINTIPHILASLVPLFTALPSVVLDGELYSHKYCDDFQELSSVLKKKNPTEEQLVQSKMIVELHCYDLASAGEGCDYIEREASIALMMERYPTPFVKLVPSFAVGSHEEVKQHMESFLQEGYEGSMLRIVSYDYEAFTRSNGLLKYKHFHDEEFELVAVLPGKGSWSAYAKKITVRLPDGQLSDAGIKGNYAFCKKLLADADKLIGEQVTVKFFAYTTDGLLRHGVAIKFPNF